MNRTTVGIVIRENKFGSSLVKYGPFVFLLSRDFWMGKRKNLKMRFLAMLYDESLEILLVP